MMTRSEGFITAKQSAQNTAREAAQKQETEARRLAINAQNDAKWARERAAGQKIIDARHAALEKESIANRLAIKEKDAEIMRENQERINLRNAAKEYAKSTINATIKGKPRRWTKAEGKEAIQLYYDYIKQHSKH